jgi:hypothetical protein
MAQEDADTTKPILLVLGSLQGCIFIETSYQLLLFLIIIMYISFNLRISECVCLQKSLLSYKSIVFGEETTPVTKCMNGITHCDWNLDNKYYSAMINLW